ncbi:Non-specific lipid-transfer protein 12 [Abeliophyllum distichum]|uniref:Non-specific lipid-transfer protein n=1 Tax=Abeliophyllum distichum TaxID=126358 RepID=A0ABD1QGB8_9LAMI
MKSIFFSMVLVLSLLYCFAHFSNAAIPCGTVDMKAAACISFATGKDAKPSTACCSGLQQLAQSVKSVDDKKAICRCLKAGVKNFSGVQDKLLSQIPNACKIKVGFPVSMNTNCETLH